MTRVFLALGSNLGDRQAHLRNAIHALESPGLHVRQQSPIYETAPQGLADQDWFLNMVIEAHTALSPSNLLAHCAAIERQFHRQRTVPNGPRTIDIDILFYGEAVVKEEHLTIPHPRYTSRRFVLEPLAALEPDWHDPRSGVPIRDLLAAVQDQSLRLFRE